MTIQQKPIVGNWYMNMTGQLIKVWAVGYHQERIDTVVIEYLNGKKKVITAPDWYKLDLEIHLYKALQRRQTEETI